MSPLPPSSTLVSYTPILPPKPIPLPIILSSLPAPLLYPRLFNSNPSPQANPPTYYSKFSPCPPCSTLDCSTPILHQANPPTYNSNYLLLPPEYVIASPFPKP